MTVQNIILDGAKGKFRVSAGEKTRLLSVENAKVTLGGEHGAAKFDR